ncbi:unnamed protein product [Prunus armeniaca]|uniref:Uncharacterized protein n=1 Tax=Prunus armeniaca TaxID=36596 RepID=A0A6J5WYW8_PRUAR|nr:unnamed protein product [Prunus armeniaca]
MDCRGRGHVRRGGDSPGVVLVLLLMAITSSQLPRTSHCMMEVMSKNSNTNISSNWCNGGIGQCQLIPQEPFMMDMVELEGGSRMPFDPYASLKVTRRTGQRGLALKLCGLKKPYADCLPPKGGGNLENCKGVPYKQTCH